VDIDGSQVPAQGSQEGAGGQNDDSGTFISIINTLPAGVE
jgi:hypothetical protein